MKRGKLMLVPPVLEPVRFSKLKRIDISPAHYSAPFTETSPMRKGSALHAYMLGGEEKVAVFRDGIRNPKSSKWIDFQAKHQGKHILIPSELASVEGMRRSLEHKDNRFALELLDDGVQEQRITWTLDGRPCAGTPDCVKPKRTGTKRVTELKTDKSSAPWQFLYTAEKRAYHAQVDWYSLGLELCTQYDPGPVDEAFVVVVESTAPFPVTVFEVDPDILADGRRMWRPWFDTLLECERAGKFPAYVEGVQKWTRRERGDGLDWDHAAE
jgi:PDDEXK-like uncharacterized protein DUF3799